jgi:3-oxoadipate enol-lactonase
MPTKRLNRVEIYYEVHGGGPPVALLNGIMMNTAGWAFQTPVFARRHQVILHDMRGQGQSGKPREEYSWDTHVEDFRALLDELGVPAVNLVGVSYGAEVAMHFVLKYPERVTRLVLGTAASELTPLLKAFAQSWEVAAAERDGLKFFKLFVPSVYGSKYLQTQGEWLVQRAEAFARTVSEDWFAGFGNLLKNFYTLSITDRLRQIRVPTLVVAAEEDLIKPIVLSKLIKNAIPQAEMVIVPDSGHAAIFEKPEEFNTVVLGFLTKGL